MALKTFILENSSTKKKRHSDIQNAVREFLKNPKIKISFDENGKAVFENCEKKLYLSVTRANEVMLVVLCDKPVGIDGEYLPRITSPENKIDYNLLAERFFSVEESEYLRDCAHGTEGENFVRIWTRKEAYIKAAGKTLVDFPNFTVVENSHFLSKVHGVPLKKFAINFPNCENYHFVIAGVE